MQSGAGLPIALLRSSGQFTAFPGSTRLHTSLIKGCLLAGIGFFSASLTRQVAPRDGWYWLPGPVGLLGAVLAGSYGAQKELAQGRAYFWF